jgi:AcrR family transcriptional regulator
MPAGGRRAVLRAALVADVKRAARGQLVAGGPAAISLRAIAREVGLDPSGLYRYYPSLDALVGDLINDLYGELFEALEQARDAIPADDPVARLGAMTRAMRRWSIGNPREFQLVFGGLEPGLGAAVDQAGPVRSAGIRFGTLFLEVLLALWQQGRVPPPPDRHLHPDFASALAPTLGSLLPELPTEVAYLLLQAWTQLYGLLMMETTGQIHWAMTDPEPLFESLLAEVLDRLKAPE